MIISFPQAFRNVSVVVIAFEHSFQFELPFFKDSEIALLVGLRGICSPITPVEHIKISFSLHLINFFIFADIDLFIFFPLKPVKAFANPAFTTRALALPSDIFFLHKLTGSAGILDWVNTPATFVPLSKIAVKISLLPLYLTPDLAEPI